MSAAPKPAERLSAAACAAIDRELVKYPAGQGQSAVIAALAIAQDERGWLSNETIEEVAAYLGMPPIAVFEVASFYAMFRLEPGGRHQLTLCTNLPCALSGAGEAAAHLRQRLGVGFGETTPDGRFTLKEGECMGACGDAPVLLVGSRRMCSFMSRERIDELLEELRR